MLEILLVLASLVVIGLIGLVAVFITPSRMRKLKVLSTRTEDAWVLIVVPLAGHAVTMVVATVNPVAAVLTRLVTSADE